jgi:transcription termination factor Rho
MTSDFNEETVLPFEPFESPQENPAPAPARKRAAKKTATKKVAAKKTAAKKTAKKAARKSAKTAEPSETTEPVVVAEIPAPAPKPATEPIRETPPETPAAEITSVRPEPARAETSTPVESPAAEFASEESPRKFGRVPGGGRIERESRENRPPQGGGEPRENREPREQREPREPRGPVDHSEGQRESRSKKRRDKRKRRRERDRQERDVEGQPQGNHEPGERRQDSNERRHEQSERRQPQERAPQFSGPKIEVDGMLELAPKGFGFLRVASKRFEQARDDVFVPPEMVRRLGLRVGHWIHGLAQDGPRGPQLVEITTINGLAPEDSRRLPLFEELKAINPGKRISFETTPERFTTRVVDIMAPVGRGQRGLIVSPPRSGKTTMLLHIAESIVEKYDESLHLMVLLVDERPEEVTEFRRALPGVEIYASSNDDGARNHCRIAELAIERAKRLVEAGKDVFLLMDSITRLARAYNHTMRQHGRGTASGGITVGALEIPRRLFAAARNTRGGGSLTILATALIQTNSKADEAIFQEFKGTGNMELVLDRKIAENYLYPAVDIFKSGTRREELLLPDHMLHKIHLIRRGLSGHRPVEAMERLLFFLKKFHNNPQMLLEIKG